VAGDELGEGGLRIFAGEALKQIVVGHEAFAELSPRREKIRQGKSVEWFAWLNRVRRMGGVFSAA
jgi:hypothetical protein